MQKGIKDPIIMKIKVKPEGDFVFSTNPDFMKQQAHQDSDEKTLLPEKQNLLVFKDAKHRSGKTVTIVSGFAGTEEDLEKLAKQLKTKCGSGGSVKDFEIIIQGEQVEKVFNLLKQMQYRVKKR